MDKRYPAAHLVRYFMKIARYEEEGASNLKCDKQTIDEVRRALSFGRHRSPSPRFYNITGQTSIAARVFLMPDIMDDLIGPLCDPSTMMCLALTCKQLFQQLAYEVSDMFLAAATFFARGTELQCSTIRRRNLYETHRESWKFHEATRKDLRQTLINAELGLNGYRVPGLTIGKDVKFCAACIALHPNRSFAPEEAQKQPAERTCIMSSASIITCAHDRVSHLNLHKIVSHILSKEYEDSPPMGVFGRAVCCVCHAVEFLCKHCQRSAKNDRFEGIKTHLSTYDGSRWTMQYHSLLRIARKEIFEARSHWALHKKSIPRGPIHERIDDVGQIMACKHQMPSSTLIVDAVICNVDPNFEESIKFSQGVCSDCEWDWGFGIAFQDDEHIWLQMHSNKSLGLLRSLVNKDVLQYTEPYESLESTTDVEDTTPDPVHPLKPNDRTTSRKENVGHNTTSQPAAMPVPETSYTMGHERYLSRKILSDELQAIHGDRVAWKYSSKSE